MIDDILLRRPKKPLKHLNIVPILDMLTTIIFFLLMSTTFIEYTKLTLPPAKTVSTPSTATAPPVLAKLMVTNSGNSYHLKLAWQGSVPGEDQAESNSQAMVPNVQALLKKFKAKYPDERTLQVSLDKSVRYQILVSVMDASKDFVPDVVLLSYREVSQ